MRTAKNPQEAYRSGYVDGLRMAKKLRWQGTFLASLLKGSRYRPDRDYRAEYDEGFRQAMKDASTEWKPPATSEG